MCSLATTRPAAGQNDDYMMTGFPTQTPLNPGAAPGMRGVAHATSPHYARWRRGMIHRHQRQHRPSAMGVARMPTQGRGGRVFTIVAGLPAGRWCGVRDGCRRRLDRHVDDDILPGRNPARDALALLEETLRRHLVTVLVPSAPPRRSRHDLDALHGVSMFIIA